MTELEAMEARCSIRKYSDKNLEEDIVRKIENELEICNAKSGLHMQLIVNKPKAFDSLFAHYGGFRNARNYIALVGKDNERLEELCGYYGEHMVLFLQQLGLGTCWVGGTFNKKKTDYICNEGEKFCLLIALGYSDQEGRKHKSKSIAQVAEVNGEAPKWFMDGVKAALLAPTAINQQKFHFRLRSDDKVELTAFKGPFSIVDLGIVKYHFEVGVKRKDIWVKG
ncbi:MAG: nitroreductase [Solobacterium sp.]|nr:nitroreductase [Solobacterium sp.]